MARKRPVEEIESFEVESLDAVDKPVSTANICRMITSLLPVKKGRMRNYFDETVSDGTSKLCMVGFNVKQQMAMNDFLERNEAVELKDCQIQRAQKRPQYGSAAEEHYGNNWIGQKDICF